MKKIIIITCHVSIDQDYTVHSPKHVIILRGREEFTLSGFHRADNGNGAWPAQPLGHICRPNMLGTGDLSGHLHTTPHLLSAHQPPNKYGYILQYRKTSNQPCKTNAFTCTFSLSCKLFSTKSVSFCSVKEKAVRVSVLNSLQLF